MEIAFGDATKCGGPAHAIFVALGQEDVEQS